MAEESARISNVGMATWRAIWVFAVIPALLAVIALALALRPFLRLTLLRKAAP